MMEQILEAVPQTIIGGVYFYLDQESHLWEKTTEELFPILYTDHKTQVSINLICVVKKGRLIRIKSADW